MISEPDVWRERTRETRRGRDGEARRLIVNAAPSDAAAMTSLLSDFVSFHAARPYGSLGYVEMKVEPVPGAWVESFARLADDAEVFGTLPDGSLLVVARTSEGEKVILLGSEGAIDALGESVVDFLWRWSRGETGEAYDLNEGSVADIATWLRERGIAEPSSPKVAFDASAWLEGGSVDMAPVVDRVESDATPEALEPILREVANAVGRRADDTRVVELVAGLGKRVPASLSDSKWVEAPKRGLQLLRSLENGEERESVQVIPALSRINPRSVARA